ncbi:hypothetical protein SB861_68815, partial [Paraburkholderia sp. SIMBA_049]
SAFGMDRVRQEGHRAFLATAAASGATGFEVRRELFTSDDDATPAALAALAIGVLPNLPGFLHTAFPASFPNVPAFFNT